jgi:ferredoxin-type protein NapF
VSSQTRREFLFARFGAGGSSRAPRAAAELKAAITPSCLALNHVVCSACAERCEVGAIRFQPALGAAPTPAIDLDRCTGCGACVAVCPVSAITLSA